MRKWLEWSQAPDGSRELGRDGVAGLCDALGPVPTVHYERDPEIRERVEELLALVVPCREGNE